MRIALPLSLTLAVIAGAALAQGQPRGTGTVMLNKEIMSAVEKTAKDAVDEFADPRRLHQQRVQCRRRRGASRATAGRDIGGGIEHSEITEVYHVISGTGTLVLGGNIENAKATAADSPVVRVLNGPSTGGGRVIGGTGTTLGPATSSSSRPTRRIGGPTSRRIRSSISSCAWTRRRCCLRDMR